MRNIFKKLLPTILVSFLVFGVAQATTVLFVPQGGTGVSTISGLIKGNGTAAFSAASAGTDYLVPCSSLTTGSALFSNSSNQVCQDNANYFYNATNHRLGIGTITPAQKLDISGGGLRFTSITTPDVSGTLVTLAGLGAGNLSNGVYSYKVTFVNALGESVPSSASAPVTVTNNATNGQISLANIPTSSDPSVTSRKLYRTVHDGSSYLLLTTISDNTTTTYTDNIADGSLTTAA